MKKTGKKIVIFDFDKTIVSVDSGTALLFYLLKKSIFKCALAMLVFPFFLLLVKHDWTRKFAHSLLLTVATLGIGEQELIHVYRKFSNDYFNNMKGAKIFTEALCKMKEHLAEGDNVIILTASHQALVETMLSGYIEKDEVAVIGSRFGHIKTLKSFYLKEHCYKNKKLEMFYRHYGEKVNFDIVYSDGHGDMPIFLNGNKRYLINPKEKTREIANRTLSGDFKVLNWG